MIFSPCVNRSKCIKSLSRHQLSCVSLFWVLWAFFQMTERLFLCLSELNIRKTEWTTINCSILFLHNDQSDNSGKPISTGPPLLLSSGNWYSEGRLPLNMALPFSCLAVNYWYTFVKGWLNERSSSLPSLKCYFVKTQLLGRRGYKQLRCLYSFLCSSFNGSTREAYFSVGLQGISEESIDTVKQIIATTIDDVIE